MPRASRREGTDGLDGGAPAVFGLPGWLDPNTVVPLSVPTEEIMYWDQDLFKRALDFAAHAHGEQKVPGSGVPYVVHVVKVATEVLGACAGSAFDADLAATVALLHDTMEDAGVGFASMDQAFGTRVAEGVRALTKDQSLPKADQMQDSLARIRLQPKEIWLVKLGDRITNLEPPPSTWAREKRRAYLQEAGIILEGLRGASPILEERLRGKMASYSAYC